MINRHVILVACIAALGLAGCQHIVADPLEDGPFPKEFNSTALLSRSLEDRVHVTHHAYARTTNNTFEVTCTLKNLTSRPLTVQARTQYFGADREHQEGPGAWQIIHLPATGIESYQSISYSPDVSYYHVEILPL